MLVQQAAQLRRVLPLVLGGLCLWLLWQKGGTLDWHAVRRAFADIPAPRWIAAALLTGGSFWALAQYDLIAHRHFGTGTRDHVARRSGASAIALGQVIGMGPAVGASVRWRLMPGLGHGRILQLTAFVTLTFLAAWAVLALVFALPVLSGHPLLVLLSLPLALLAGGAALLRFPRLRLLGRSLTLPSLPAAAQLLALSFCDMGFAALALYVLLPPDLGLSFLPVLAVYMLALGAGLVAGTPGGIGPFELAMTGLIPHVDIELLAASLLAYRASYYALPCLVGAAYAMVAQPDRSAPDPALPAPLSGRRAEHAIAAQADALGLRTDTGAACLLRSPQTLTLFLGPTHGDLAPLLPDLRAMARAQNRLACLYKVEARDAAALRRAGWHVAPVAQEAVLNPQGFSLDGACHRQLRRSIRKAEKSGVEIRRLTRPDWAEMARINALWAAAHGGERGLTMGRFCPEFLADKPIFAAFAEGRMLAFATAVQTPGALSLDLMRHVPGAPSGTMHAVVAAMIEHARLTGRTELSLAALPNPRLARFASGAEGLARFKNSFGPDWRPLYIAAPNRVALLLAGLDLWLAIRFPAPLAPLPAAVRADPWQADREATAPSRAPLRETG
ncbi:phosphatidylglycerol lysyltransferase domain-containing protein [Tropicibacter oceani]|uniref:Phosphatidylglycerol lysyltransferase domain-containing protein n=1 Tax=Tropicibacter oceani TaxID=3058420 RepID=A0ABY8QFT4_9RHOB|nr:phosphatidylglycerol lysyltransferase domain-containing protein [Tropicibacter oceani]WGW02667.1 phosphatidylglycerol lysyltransferase domain-containing protein [Tropicibacter oceani]